MKMESWKLIQFLISRSVPSCYILCICPIAFTIGHPPFLPKTSELTITVVYPCKLSRFFCHLQHCQVYVVSLRMNFFRVLRVSEREWFVEALESSVRAQTMNEVFLEMPAFLQRITPSDRFLLLPQSFKLLTVHRAYRSLAVLFGTCGARQSMVESYSTIISTPLPGMDAIYNDSYRDLEFQVRSLAASYKSLWIVNNFR